MIPLVDLGAQYESIKDEVDSAMKSVISAGAFILGPEVAGFESAFAGYCRAEHCVGVASGLDALTLSLQAAGIVPGDEVIVPVNTFIATALAVSRAGAKPVLVDCEEDTFQIDPGRIADALTGRTKAVMPVHLYGQCADMEAVGRIAAERGLVVIEDAAQSHGAERNGHRSGSMGLAGCFSFYPAKNLGAFGDGGAVVTSDAEIASRIRAMRDYGQSQKYHHVELGANSRLDTIQAAVLSVKLARLDGWNAARRQVATWYDEELAGLAGEGRVTLPRVAEGNEHVWHLYVVRLPGADRGSVLESLRASGIGAGVHYPVPIHMQPAYGGMGLGAGCFPVAERLAGEIVSLPMFPEMRRDQVAQVAAALGEALDG